MSKFLDVRWNKVFHCETKKKKHPFDALPLEKQLLETDDKPVFISALRRSLSKSSSSPGHIPSLKTTMIWPDLRVTTHAANYS